jgi:hypothetical protein
MKEGNEGLKVSLTMLGWRSRSSPSSSFCSFALTERTMVKVGRFVTDPRAGAQR